MVFDKKENTVLTDDRTVLIDLDCCKMARNNTHCDINESLSSCVSKRLVKFKTPKDYIKR